MNKKLTPQTFDILQELLGSSRDEVEFNKMNTAKDNPHYDMLVKGYDTYIVELDKAMAELQTFKP